MYTHASEDKLPHRCDMCGMTFVLRNKLLAHTRLKHKPVPEVPVEKIVEDAPTPSNIVEIETRELVFEPQVLHTPSSQQIIIVTQRTQIR